MDEQLKPISTHAESLPEKFVGREKILDMIDKAVADVPNKHVFLLVGEGGIGKTALLREIYKKYKNKSDVLLIRLDMSLAGMVSLLSVELEVTRQVLEAGFYKMEDAIAIQPMSETAQHALDDGANEEDVNQLLLDAHQAEFAYFNQILNSSGKRMIVLCDSIDMTTENFMQDAIPFSSTFNNSVLIYAGRPGKIVDLSYDSLFPSIYTAKSWQIHKCNLDRFDLSCVEHYFNLVLSTPLTQELVETITILTEGKPVLLALTAEWFKQNVQLPSEINLSKQQLEQLSPVEKQDLHVQFERALVERVRSVQGPLDKAILYMSFLDRRYDRQILQMVLNLSSAEIELLEPQLRQMAFIRYFMDDSSGLLHDEAKELINRHAWPPYDPDGDERRSLASLVIKNYYLPKIAQLHKEASTIAKDKAVSTIHFESGFIQDVDPHELEMECLDYHYRISLDHGRRYVTQLIRESISLRKRENIPYEIIKRANEFEAKVAIARMNIIRGQYGDSRETLEKALQSKDLSAWYQITLLSALSNTPGVPNENIGFLKQAMAIAEQANDQKELAGLYNQMGLAYRNQGLWDQAENAYNRTLTILKSFDDPAQKAATLNNLAYVHLLQGKLDEAENLVDIALGIRKKLGNEVAMAFSYQTMGEVADAKGNVNQAVHAYQMAENLFKAKGREQEYALALVRLAEFKRRENDYQGAEKLLQPGLNQPSKVKASAERELGILYLTQAGMAKNEAEKHDLLKKAIETASKSISTSRQKNDWHGQAQAIYDVIFASYKLNHQIDEHYADQLRAILTQYGYPVVRARLDEVYAEIAYEHGDMETAFRLYMDALKVFSTHHLRKHESTFNRLKQRLFELPQNTQINIVNYFDQMAYELPQGSRLRSSLSGLCQAIKTAW